MGSIRRRGVWVRWWLGSLFELVDRGFERFDLLVSLVLLIVPLDERFEVVEHGFLKVGKI